MIGSTLSNILLQRWRVASGSSPSCKNKSTGCVLLQCYLQSHML